MHTISEKEEIALVLKGSLLKFTSFFYKLLTGRDFIVSTPVGRESHHLTIAKALTKAARLELENHRLIINTPPGSGKPLCAKTLVLREDGSRMQMKDICIGDKILTHAGRFQRVLNIFHQGKLDTLKITTFSGREVISAYDHSFLTAKGYKEAKDLEIGDVLGVAVPENDFGACVSDYEARLLGYFVGDGSLSSNAANITASDPDEIKDIFYCCEKMGFSCNLVQYNLPEKKCKTLGRINFRNGVRGWLASHNLNNKTSYEKRVPELIMKGNRNAIINFLAAYYVCDAYIAIKQKGRKDLIVSLSSVSKGLIEDCMHLMTRLGIRAQIRKKTKNITTKKQGETYTHYELNFSSQNEICNFQKIIAPFMFHEKANILKKQNILRTRFDERILPDAIVKIENHEKTDCMCFEVEGDHTFTANDIIVHNSTLMTMFVAWTLAQYPDSKYIYVSYSKTLADKMTEQIKRIISLREYAEIFDVHIRKDSKAKDYFQTENGGAVASAGSSGTITGLDAGLAGLDRFSGCLILDDLIKPDEAHSTTLREAVIENFSQTLVQRLRGKNVPIILIGQRVHECDISQYIIDGKDGYNWTKVIIKAIDEANNIIYPEVYSREMLEKRKATDAYVFSSQYQQEPVPAGGALYKPDWFVLLDEEPAMLCTFVVADTAETSKTYNDATAISFFGVYKLEDGSYALHCIDALEVHVEPRELKELFLDFWNHCMRYATKPKFAAIEKKSTGVSLISAIQEIRGIRLIDIARSAASGSKTKRFLDAQPFIAERRISFSRYAKHTSKCIEHMIKITANDSHAKDDLADTVADAIRMTFIDKTVINSTDTETDYNELSKDLMSNSFHIAALRAKAYNNR